MAATLVTSCTALPTEGALRLQTGKAGSAALAEGEGASTLVTSRHTLRLQTGKAGSAAHA